jgi:hypothetical protein
MAAADRRAAPRRVGPRLGYHEGIKDAAARPPVADYALEPKRCSEAAAAHSSGGNGYRLAVRLGPERDTRREHTPSRARRRAVGKASETVALRPRPSRPIIREIAEFDLDRQSGLIDR